MDAEKRYENYLYAVLAVCAILVGFLAGCIVLGMIIGIAEAVSGNS